MKKLIVTYDDKSNMVETILNIREPLKNTPFLNLAHITSFSLPMDEVYADIRAVSCFRGNKYLNDPTLNNLKLIVTGSDEDRDTTGLRRFFEGCSYNQPLDKWDVSRVSEAYLTFHNSEFHQDLGMWNIQPTCNCTSIFKNSKFTIDEVKNWKWVKELNQPVEKLFGLL